MIQSLIYLRISGQPPKEYDVLLLRSLKKQLPYITTFDFDNFSEESIRQYALELVKQSGQTAVVVAVEAAEASIAGISTFFNRLIKIKPERLVLILQGEQPVLHKMMQTIGKEYFYHNLAAERLNQLLVQYFAPV